MPSWPVTPGMYGLQQRLMIPKRRIWHNGAKNLIDHRFHMLRLLGVLRAQIPGSIPCGHSGGPPQRALLFIT